MRCSELKCAGSYAMQRDGEGMIMMQETMGEEGSYALPPSHQPTTPQRGGPTERTQQTPLAGAPGLAAPVGTVPTG